MVREIIKDTAFLQQVSVNIAPHLKDVSQVIRDLIDTAEEHRERCVGLSAIQIGEPLRVFVVYNGQSYIPIVNPIVIRRFGEVYEAEESCMSLEGTRKVKRYKGIEIFHRKGNKLVKGVYRGFMAQIIQHEMDHLSGKLI